MEKITQILVKEGFIKNEYEEIVLFGLKQLKYLLINIIIILAAGVIFREILSSICFLVAFVSLRSYAGGYHSSTVARCYSFSIIIVIGVMCSFKMPIWREITILFIVLLSSVVLWILTPVDNKNHRLTENERMYFRKRAHSILMIEILLSLFGWFFQFTNFYKGISAAIIITVGLVIMGIIENIRECR